MTCRPPIVAIDGPAGAGKSTVARRLADVLGFLYIDTGAMYRSVALAALRAGVSRDDEAAVTKLAERLDLRLEPGRERTRVLLGGEDVSEAIRTPEVSTAASEVSRWPGVRAAMVALQRRMGGAGGVVMEGRDIGTVVFPNAEVKIYLTASIAERARRRCAELQASGECCSEQDVARLVQERDRRDSERDHSPLSRAPDAVEVFTDGLDVDQVVERLTGLVRERARA